MGNVKDGVRVAVAVAVGSGVTGVTVVTTSGCDAAETDVAVDGCIDTFTLEAVTVDEDVGVGNAVGDVNDGITFFVSAIAEVSVNLGACIK